MKQFEYKRIKVDNFYFIMNSLVLEGRNGWELICFDTYITDNYAYFKREIISKTAKKHPSEFRADSPSGH